MEGVLGALSSCAGLSDVTEVDHELVIARCEEPLELTIVDVGRALGRPRASVLVKPGSGRPAESPVHRVTPEPDGRPVTDGYGTTILSTTFDEIPPHTDAVNSATPPDLVLLACATNDAGATTDFFSPAALADLLSESGVDPFAIVLPGRAGPSPLFARGAGSPMIRLNLHELRADTDRRAATGSGAAELRELLRTLSDHVARLAPVHRFTLSSGDLLVWRNGAWLHGRSAVRPTSTKRLLFRLWVDET